MASLQGRSGSPCQLKVVFPSERTVEECDYSAARGYLQLHTPPARYREEWLSILFPWEPAPSCPSLIPHSKIICALDSEGATQWMYIGSHNLSQVCFVCKIWFRYHIFSFSLTPPIFSLHGAEEHNRGYVFLIMRLVFGYHLLHNPPQGNGWYPSVGVLVPLLRFRIILTRYHTREKLEGLINCRKNEYSIQLRRRKIKKSKRKNQNASEQISIWNGDDLIQNMNMIKRKKQSNQTAPTNTLAEGVQSWIH